MDGAIAALQAVLTDALADGLITEKAFQDIEKHVEGSLDTFAEGNTGDAIKKLDDLESKIDELEERDEVSNQTEQRLDRALEDLARAMFLADPAAGDDSDDDD